MRNSRLQRIIVSFWAVLLVFSFLAMNLFRDAAFVSAEETDVFVYHGASYRRSVDVPAIYLVGVSGVNVTNYVSCTVVALDAAGGAMKEVVDENALIRIRGNSTSSGAKKPFNIKFSSKIDLFGMGKGKKYCLIANLFDPTLLRNHLAFEFAKSIGLAYTPDSMLVDVYLNGRYQGCYQLCEAISDDKARVDIDCDNGDFILERDARTDVGTTYFTSMLGIRFGINEPDDTTAEQAKAIRNTVMEAEEALISADYEMVKRYFDISSLIDEYICLELFKNVDIDCASTRFYCKDGLLYGGPVWDFDLSAGNCSSIYYVAYNGVDSTKGIWCDCLWFRYLLRYEEFRKDLYLRYLELQDAIINLYADNILGNNRIDCEVQKAETSIKRNFSEAGWNPGITYCEYMRIPESTYESNLEYLRTWLRRRNEWLLQEWKLESLVAPLPKASSLFYSEGYLCGFSPETPVAELSDLFLLPVISSAKGEFLATGDFIRGMGASYVIVVEGDLNGDGILSAVDYLILKQILRGTYQPEAAFYLAACFNGEQPAEAGCERLKQACTNPTA